MIQESNLNQGGGTPLQGSACPTPSPMGQSSSGQSSSGMGQSESLSGTSPSHVGESTESSIPGAADVRRNVKEKAGQAVNRLSETFDETARQAQEQAARTAQRLREQGQTILGQQKDRVAEEISHFGAAAHDAADRLDQENDHNVAHYVHAVADQLDRLAGYLRENNINRFMDDAGRAARRSPELFFGGMFLAGMALARFFKASGKPRRREMESWRDDEWSDTQDFDARPDTGSTAADWNAGGFRDDGPDVATASLSPTYGSVVSDPEPSLTTGSGPVITSENSLRPAEAHTIPSATTGSTAPANTRDDDFGTGIAPDTSTSERDRPLGATCPPGQSSEVL